MIEHDLTKTNLHLYFNDRSKHDPYSISLSELGDVQRWKAFKYRPDDIYFDQVSR